MKTLNKKEFIERATNEALSLQLNADRRRRLEGRLNLALLEMVSDLLPKNVKFQETSKGNIRADYFALNSKYTNLHIFTNNTASIIEYDKQAYQIILVCKATCQGVFKVKTSLCNKRLNLNDILALYERNEITKHNKLSEVLGL